MNIRSIRVADWRCFLDDIEVGPFEEGLNIIYAPNGTGKSTLFEALKRALLDGHKVTGKDVESIRPWGRNLAPKVTVEFIHDDQEYRVTKQFLDSPGALLERKEDGRYCRIAEGASADEQTREILTKNPPGKGLAKTPNWGIAQVLWAPQGGAGYWSTHGRCGLRYPEYVERAGFKRRYRPCREAHRRAIPPVLQCQRQVKDR